MKPWIKRTLFGIFGASIVLGGLGACAHRHAGHGLALSEEDAQKFQSRLVERAGKELALDAQQKQRLAALGDRLREQRQALVGRTTDPRAEFQAMVAGSQFDRTRAQAIIDDKTGALRNKGPEVIAAAAEFFDSLKPQQQQKVRDFLQGRRGWFHHG